MCGRAVADGYRFASPATGRCASSHDFSPFAEERELPLTRVSPRPAAISEAGSHGNDRLRSRRV